MNHDDYAIAEWYQDNRRIEGKELAGVYRRMAKRGHAPDEHHIDRPVIRQAPAPLGTPAKRRGKLVNLRCAHCGEMFTATNTLRRYCTHTCGNAHRKANAA